jgi:DNA-binding CsgD family transcriptional regulator
VLSGRDHEYASLLSTVDAARTGRGATVVVRGERGSGRTALLDAVARAAGDAVRVLTVTGVATEAHLPFAAVHQLLRVLEPWQADLPEPQAAALRTVFGLDTADFDPYLISLSVLALLSRAAARTPLLVVVDDADLLDRRSAGTLAFAARRVSGEPLAFLVATTGDDDEQDGPDWSGLPELRLGPLGRAVCRDLVARHCPGATTAVTERLVDDAGGNPQVLIELCEALPGDVRRGRQPMPVHVAPAGRLGRALAARFERLPPDTRTALLVVAAEGTGGLGTVLGACRSLGLDDAALAPAVAAGLLAVDQGRLWCRPAVLAAVAYHASPLPARLRAHEVLAGAPALDHAGQVRHRAECALGVDEDLAADMAAVARRHRQAGDPHTAVEVLNRAATLTADPARRARLLVDAAGCAWLADNPPRAAALVEAAAPLARDADVVAGIALLRGLREHGDGSPATAYRLLLDGAQPVMTAHPRLAARMLATAEHAAWLADDGAGREKAADLRGTLTGVPPDDGPASASLYPPAVPDDRADERSDDRGDDHGDDHGGPLPSLADSAFIAALPDVVADVEGGRWDRAEERTAAVVRGAAGNGQSNSAWLATALLAWVAAMRGDAPTCHRLAEAVLDVAAPRSLLLAGALAQWAVGLLALGEGRIDEATGRLRDVVGGRRNGHAAVAVAAVADLLEALVRAGNYAEAWQLLNRFDGDGAPLRQRFGGALAVRCRAMVAGRGSAPLFEDALRGPALPPFETARTQLVYGEWLRRHREVRSARVRLHAALDTFELLGARPWAARCRAELRAAGHRVGAERMRADQDRVVLTPRELQIACSVAAGKSNREVAAELFISPRTVSDHLYKLFPKLGISSRHELRDLRLELGLADE